MDDIEDLGNTVAPAPRLEERPIIVSKRHIKKKNDIIEPSTHANATVPGTQTVYLKTWGCGHNMSDSEYMAGLLSEYGYTVTENINTPGIDAYIFNSCTVKNPSQDHFLTSVHDARKTGRPVIVAGCVPQGDPKHSGYKDLSVIGTQAIDRVVEVVEQALQGNTVRLLERKLTPSLDMPKIRRNPLIEIIPINIGCLNQCTYCKTQHARGKLKSWSVAEIVARARSAIEEGVKEIRLTSEDTGAYGLDIGTNIVELLDALVDILPDGVMLRVGMTNPPYILNQLPGIVRILNHPNVYSFMHVPVQAGSDQVLEDMKRTYSRADFELVCDTLIQGVPGISIMTDIICGFPTESQKNFRQTLTLLEKYQLPFVNITQFYPRPGTPAARMKQVDGIEKKKRTKAVSELFQSYTCFDDMVGNTYRVWITEMASDGVHYAAHTKGYVQVLVPPRPDGVDLRGTSTYVRITGASKFSVTGVEVSKDEAAAAVAAVGAGRGGAVEPAVLKAGKAGINKDRDSDGSGEGESSKGRKPWSVYPPLVLGGAVVMIGLSMYASTMG